MGSNVSSILGIDLFETEILPLLNEVTIDQKWRVRNSIVTNIADIGIQMGKDKFCKSRLRMTKMRTALRTRRRKRRISEERKVSERQIVYFVVLRIDELRRRMKPSVPTLCLCCSTCFCDD